MAALGPVGRFGQADSQGAARRAHGMEGVGREVHDDLLNLHRRGQHAHVGAGQLLVDGDGRRQAGAQQLEALADDRGDEHRHLFRGRLAAEGEDLLHQVGGAAAALADVQQVAVHLGARLGVQQGHVREADDAAEDVVEIVGDAARQGADGLHLLGLAHARLDLGLVGDVPLHTDEVGDGAGRVAHRRDRGRGHEQAAVPAAVDEAPAPDLALVDQFLDLLVEMGLLLLFEQHPHRLADAFLPAVAGHGREGGIDVLDGAPAIGDEHRLLHLVHRLGQPGAALLGRALGGHVADDDDALAAPVLAVGGGGEYRRPIAVQAHGQRLHHLAGSRPADLFACRQAAGRVKHPGQRPAAERSPTGRRRHGGRLLVGVEHDSVRIGQQHAHGRELEQAGQLLFRRPPPHLFSSPGHGAALQKAEQADGEHRDGRDQQPLGAEPGHGAQHLRGRGDDHHGPGAAAGQGHGNGHGVAAPRAGIRRAQGVAGEYGDARLAALQLGAEGGHVRRRARQPVEMIARQGRIRRVQDVAGAVDEQDGVVVQQGDGAEMTAGHPGKGQGKGHAAVEPPVDADGGGKKDAVLARRRVDQIAHRR